MTALPVINGVSRVAIKWLPLNSVNVMHFFQSSIDPDVLYAAINNHVTAPMWDTTPASQGAATVSITPLDGTSPTRIYIPPTVPKWTGNSPGEPIPAVAVVVSQHTAFRGRSFRGRSFIGPVSENSSSGPFLDNTHKTNIVNAWQAFRTAMETDGIHHSVASYKLSSAKNVISYSVRDAFGIIRNRQDSHAT